MHCFSFLPATSRETEKEMEMFMFHGGNVMGIAGGMSWHSSCPITDFDVNGFEFLVVFLDSGFITQ